MENASAGIGCIFAGMGRGMRIQPNPTKANPIHGWTRPMFISALCLPLDATSAITVKLSTKQTCTLTAMSFRVGPITVARRRDVVVDTAAGVGTADRGAQIATAANDADGLVELQTWPRHRVAGHVQAAHAADE